MEYIQLETTMPSLFFITYPERDHEDADEPFVNDFAVADSEDEAYLKLMEQNSWLKDFWMYPEERSKKITRLQLNEMRNFGK